MTEAVVLVDAHVHVYPNFKPSLLFSSAYGNFACHAKLHGSGAAAWQGILMLSETSACNWFAQVHAAATASFDGWSVARIAGDDLTLSVTGPAQQRLLIIAGRQVNSREGVEVLTLATGADVGDGATLDETIRGGVEAGAVVILPWGAGKWLGSRGKLVARTLAENKAGVFAGDNGGRPWLWPRPAVFAAAERRGRPVLSGTDPLPIAGHESRVGRYGFIMRGALDETRPGSDLRQRLLGSTVESLQPFGRCESVHGFALSQLRLRLA